MVVLEVRVEVIDLEKGVIRVSWRVEKDWRKMIRFKFQKILEVQFNVVKI